MKRVLSILFIAALALPIHAQTGDPNPVDFGPKEPLIIESESGDHEFMVEVADDREEQIHGYMFKESLEPTDGMIFEFEKPAVQTIWMKNTPIPLDILFVRSNGKILKIEHSAQPYKLRSASSEAPVAAVVELAGGRSKELGIRPGDLVRHDFFNTATKKASQGGN